MPDPRTDPVPHPDPEIGQAVDPVQEGDRRSFLRQLSTDAVWTAGKIAGASTAIRRSLVVTGEATIVGLDDATEWSSSVVERPAVAGSATPAMDSLVPASAAGRLATPDPVAALSPEQHALLDGALRAALAVNDPGGHPLLAFSIYHWDGAVIRLPTHDFSARTINIDRDPRVSLLIEDVSSEGWATVSGMASLVYGIEVEAHMRRVLEKYHAAAEVTARWEQMRSNGDQVVAVIRPTRFTWRSG